MFFTSRAQQLKKCVNLLKGISAQRNGDANRFAVCAHGLEAILCSLEQYDKNVVLSHKFKDSLAKALDELAAVSPGAAQDDGEGTCVVDDLVFSMVEDLAVIMRESSLRNGIGALSEGERQVMDYFERRGFWFLGDQTMATEYYYSGLPIALMRPVPAP